MSLAERHTRTLDWCLLQAAGSRDAAEPTTAARVRASERSSDDECRSLAAGRGGQTAAKYLIIAGANQHGGQRPEERGKQRLTRARPQWHVASGAPSSGRPAPVRGLEQWREHTNTRIGRVFASIICSLLRLLSAAAGPTMGRRRSSWRQASLSAAASETGARNSSAASAPPGGLARRFRSPSAPSERPFESGVGRAWPSGARAE